MTHAHDAIERQQRGELLHTDEPTPVYRPWLIAGTTGAVFVGATAFDPNLGPPAATLFGVSWYGVWQGLRSAQAAWIACRADHALPGQEFSPRNAGEDQTATSQGNQKRNQFRSALAHQDPPPLAVPASAGIIEDTSANAMTEPAPALVPQPDSSASATRSEPHLLLTYREDATSWWNSFPGLTRAMLQPLTVVGKDQQSRALAPREAAEKLLYRLRKEPVTQAILSVSQGDADSPENPAMLMITLRSEPGSLLLTALRGVCAAVATEPCETPGDHALFIVLAKPCDYTLEKGNRMVQQQRMIEKLPIAPLFTDLIRAWHGRIEMKIPIALQVNPETGRIEIAWFDLRSQTHLGGFGRTGAGKDQMMSTWMFALVLMNKAEYVQVCAIDPKGGADYAWVGRCPNAWRPTAATEEAITARVEELYSFIKFRGELLSHATLSTLRTVAQQSPTGELGSEHLQQQRQARKTIATIAQKHARAKPVYTRSERERLQHLDAAEKDPSIPLQSREAATLSQQRREGERRRLTQAEATAAQRQGTTHHPKSG